MLGSGDEPGPNFNEIRKKLSIEEKSFIITVPLPNEKGKSTMLNKDYTTTLLNLEDVIIQKIESTQDEVHVYIQLPRRAHKCPKCGELTERVHDYREQAVKDIPFARATLLYLKKRRYCCPACGKRFYEDNPFLGRYRRMTTRLIGHIISQFKNLKPAAEIARECRISSMTALRCFDWVNYQCRSLPYVLSIDEFKGNAGGEKYQTIVTDAKNRKVLDILPNRYENDLIRYFLSFSNRNNVAYFVTDMNQHFRNVANICFPKAKIVADRFHVVRQVIWAMENVRKTEQKKLSERYRKYFKRSKSLLSKPMERLTEEEMDRLALMFEISPRLAKAYDLKNKFIKVMRSEGSEEGRKRLKDWLFLAEFQALPEFAACITAYRNWFCEILNALDVPYSNGYTEGCNNKTKVLKRVCFGVRNFRRFRNRILHCST